MAISEELLREHEAAALAATKTLRSPWTKVSIREHLEALLEKGGRAFDLDQPTDIYSDGIVAELEQRVASLLGKPAAVYLPSGTLAQQITMRVWSERSGSSKVALHEQSHIMTSEDGSFPRVSGLTPVPIASGTDLIDAAGIAALPSDVGAVMFELPARESGFLLPSWDELAAATEVARERGIVVHFDGARLWESTTHFGRTVAEISALADTVYVSFYKALGGLSGAVVAGPEDVIEEIRSWRLPYGGRVWQQFPAALSALIGLDEVVPRLPSYVEKARIVAAELEAGLRAGGVEPIINPAVPHIHQFQVWLPEAPEVLTRAVIDLARETGLFLFPAPWRLSGMRPGLSMTEVTVSDEGLAWLPGEVEAAAKDFAERVR